MRVAGVQLGQRAGEAERLGATLPVEGRVARRLAAADDAVVQSDHEIAALADPGQHFLVSSGKLSQLVAAAGIRPEDDVLEVGAGIGTVARVLPQSRSLTVVELDARLIRLLRENVPHARVLQGDALKIILGASFDVLIGNLPHAVTESLLRLLPGLSFRVAVLAVSDSSDVGQLGPAFSWSEVTRAAGGDFTPPQPGVSRVVRVVPARLHAAAGRESSPEPGQG